jgi:hypothetical protein
MRGHKKHAKPSGQIRGRADRVIISISLPIEVVERLDAFGQREEARIGVDPSRRGTLGAMLIRKGLDAVEAEAGA